MISSVSLYLCYLVRKQSLHSREKKDSFYYFRDDIFSIFLYYLVWWQSKTSLFHPSHAQKASMYLHLWHLLSNNCSECKGERVFPAKCPKGKKDKGRRRGENINLLPFLLLFSAFACSSGMKDAERERNMSPGWPGGRFQTKVFQIFIKKTLRNLIVCRERENEKVITSWWQLKKEFLPSFHGDGGSERESEQGRFLTWKREKGPNAIIKDEKIHCACCTQQ